MPLLNAIATPYAEALLQVAESRQETDTVAQQARELLAIWNDSADLRHAMSSPVLEPEAKKAAITALFQDQITPSFQNLLKLLADRQRIGVLDVVLIRFLELYRELRNIALAKV
ncbi:MAG TPA: ATP synthase F1 subunit delta, partial [Cyanobium sp.]|nr:ATP synthase F1 subunit delta [Cyanobium sp.]